MAEEEGPERGEINGGLASSMDSIESRWVFQDEDDSEIDDEDAEEDVRHRTVMDSEDDEEDDNADQRLIRTGPRIDSFDVEALEVPGAQRNEYEVLQACNSHFYYLLANALMVSVQVAWLCVN